MISKSANATITGMILDDHAGVSLDDLCQACRVDQARIVALVEEGVVEPRSRNAQSWSFNWTTIPQVARALRLQRDFDLNPAGVAFMLDLLKEIEALDNRIKIIETRTELSS